jgi:cyclopropane-fatty-acyl-phospholipid synthase
MLPSFMKNYILKHTHIKNGNLNMELKNSEKLCFNPQDTSIIADMKIHSNKVFTNAFKKGDVGFGESYIKGHFTTSNLINLLTVFANNIDNSTTTKIINGKSILNRTFFNFISMLRKNSIKQSKKKYFLSL